MEIYVIANQTCPEVEASIGTGAPVVNSVENTAIYKCMLRSPLDGDFTRRCVHGEWLGDVPTCSDYCELDPLYSRGFYIYVTSTTGIPIFKSTQRFISNSVTVSLVCGGGSKPSDPYSNLLYQIHNCTSILKLLATDLFCETVMEFPYPRATITTGLSLDSVTLGQNSDDITDKTRTEFIDSRVAITFEADEEVVLVPKANFAVQEVLTWYSFIRIPISDSGTTPIITWSTDVIDK